MQTCFTHNLRQRALFPLKPPPLHSTKQGEQGDIIGCHDNDTKACDTFLCHPYKILSLRCLGAKMRSNRLEILGVASLGTWACMYASIGLLENCSLIDLRSSDLLGCGLRSQFLQHMCVHMTLVVRNSLGAPISIMVVIQESSPLTTFRQLSLVRAQERLSSSLLSSYSGLTQSNKLVWPPTVTSLVPSWY